MHPRAVSTVRLDGKRVEAQTVRDVGVFFIAYMFIIAVMTLLILWTASASPPPSAR